LNRRAILAVIPINQEAAKCGIKKYQKEEHKLRNPIVRPLTLPRLTAHLIAIVAVAALLYSPSPGVAAGVAPALGAAQSSSVLGASTVTNTGVTTITGDLGVSRGTAITGFPPGVVIGGTIHTGGVPRSRDLCRASADEGLGRACGRGRGVASPTIPVSEHV
jgi:ice-binding like protein